MEPEFKELRNSVSTAHKALTDAQSVYTRAKQALDTAVARCHHVYDVTHDYVPYMVTERDPFSGFDSGPKHQEGLYRRVEIKTCSRCGEVLKT